MPMTLTDVDSRLVVDEQFGREGIEFLAIEGDTSILVRLEPTQVDSLHEAIRSWKVNRAFRGAVPSSFALPSGVSFIEASVPVGDMILDEGDVVIIPKPKAKKPKAVTKPKTPDHRRKK
jgi:hypothetical protein